jgi:hypothetical protein
MPADYDGAWKEALEWFFELLLAFFFPKLYAEIDWSLGNESLATELRKILPEAVAGKRVSDALVKAYATGEGEGRDPRYVHVEVQCQAEDGFPNRLDQCNALCALRLGQPVVTVAILGDDSPTWRPGPFLFECGGFRKQVEFPTAKLLDYRGREAELEAHPNPVAVLVLAHLLALETRREDAARQDGKLRLLKNVLNRMMEAEEKHQLTRLVDWLLELPADRQQKVWQEFRAAAREEQMPFMTYLEQVGYDRGLDEGERKGKIEGERKGLLEGLRLALKLKFGAAGLALLPALEAQKELDVLQKVLDAVETASAPEGLTALLPPA